MKCKECGSNRIAFLGAHSKDLSTFGCDHLKLKREGYFPDIPGVCGGDDAEFDFCLECGTIQAEFPINDNVIKQAFDDDDCDHAPSNVEEEDDPDGQKAMDRMMANLRSRVPKELL